MPVSGLTRSKKRKWVVAEFVTVSLVLMMEPHLNVKYVFPKISRPIGTSLKIGKRLELAGDDGMRRIRNPKYKSHWTGLTLILTKC